eukprot:1106306-Rhodomonas_salina.2
MLSGPETRSLRPLCRQPTRSELGAVCCDRLSILILAGDELDAGAWYRHRTRTRAEQSAWGELEARDQRRQTVSGIADGHTRVRRSSIIMIIMMVQASTGVGRTPRTLATCADHGIRCQCPVHIRGLREEDQFKFTDTVASPHRNTPPTVLNKTQETPFLNCAQTRNQQVRSQALCGKERVHARRGGRRPREC